MSTDYAGDPTLFPTTVPVLDDGDPPDAATWGVALEGLADRTAYLQAQAFTKHRIDSYDTQNGTAETFTLAAWTTSSTFYIDVLNVEVDDHILIDVCGTYEITGSVGTFGGLRLVGIDDYGGAATLYPLYGARIREERSTTRKHFSLSAYHLCITAGTTRMALQGMVDTFGVTEIDILEAVNVRVVHQRNLV